MREIGDDKHKDRQCSASWLEVLAAKVDGVVELSAFRKGAWGEANDGHHPYKHTDGDSCVEAVYC